MRWMGLFSEAQWHAIQSMNGDTIARDLRKGAPFESNTFDIVYHSHVLEHLDREAASPFLRECLRMLKPRGRLRCVVPDLEVLIKRYGDAVAGVDAEEVHAIRHYDRAVDNILEQIGADAPWRTGKSRSHRPYGTGSGLRRPTQNRGTSSLDV